jgi:phospholipid-binding lipoprotein MlaA
MFNREMKAISRQASAGAVAILLIVITGSTAAAAEDSPDPFEGFNRAVFSFNEGLDKAIVRPVAVGYEAILPTPVRTGVSNFYGNIADLLISVNSLLQGKPTDAVGDAARFIFNSTFGIAGIFDVATEMGIEKHEEDFGQTLGRWGVGPGPYLMLPVFGPRDIRDAAGLAVELVADPVGNVEHVPTRNTLSGIRLINDRAALLSADKIIEEAALDKYSYLRDAYLQRRRSLVYDGRPPREPDDE